MRLLPALLLSAACALPAFAEDEPLPPIQRYLADLYLGDVLEDIRKIYAPARDWPSHVEPRGQVRRYRVDRVALKVPIPEVDTMWLGMKKGRLAEVQLIYTAAHTRRQSVEELAGKLSLIYGAGGRAGNRFWWSDGKTVLRAFYAEVPVLAKGGGTTVELRTSLQVLDEDLYRRVDSAD